MLLYKDDIRRMATEEYATLSAALNSGQWRVLLPGRPILNAFANRTRMDNARLKTLYLRAAKSMSEDPFSEIRAIFSRFAAIAKE